MTAPLQRRCTLHVFRHKITQAAQFLLGSAVGVSVHGQGCLTLGVLRLQVILRTLFIVR